MPVLKNEASYLKQICHTNNTLELAGDALYV